MPEPIINGQVYGWSSIMLKINGKDYDASSIDYDDGVEKEAIYGMGSMPRGYGRGNYQPTCKLTMLKEDFDALAEDLVSSGQGLYSVTIPKITVCYAKEGERIRTDVINKLTPSKVTNKGAQGDKSLSVDIEFLVYGAIVRDGVKPL